MKPTKHEEDVLVDLLDVLLEEGAVVEADVLVTVGDVPLVGLKLRAALAGMTTMTDYGIFEDWEAAQRVLARYEGKDEQAWGPELPGADPTTVGPDDA